MITITCTLKHVQGSPTPPKLTHLKNHYYYNPPGHSPSNSKIYSLLSHYECFMPGMFLFFQACMPKFKRIFNVFLVCQVFTCLFWMVIQIKLTNNRKKLYFILNDLISNLFTINWSDMLQVQPQLSVLIYLFTLLLFTAFYLPMAGQGKIFSCAGEYCPQETIMYNNSSANENHKNWKKWETYIYVVHFASDNPMSGWLQLA